MFFNISIKKLFTTYRYPTRLPLSTVDIYLGINGSFFVISYQLYKCPFHLGSSYIVVIILIKVSRHLFKSIYFKSYAEITANNDNPIFVEDVLNVITS